MNTTYLVTDVGAGLFGGCVGTEVIELVSVKLFELASRSDRRREDEVRPGEPYLGGMAAHMVYGLAIAASADVLFRMGGTGRHRSDAS